MSGSIIRVLLVEDNDLDVRLLREQLADSAEPAVKLEHVSTLSDALARMAKDRFDAVLLDLTLPDSSGLDTVVRASSPQTPPILVLTGMGDESFGIQALRAGAQDYLVKGQGTGRQIARSIAHAIERFNLQAELKRSHDELEDRVAHRTEQLTSAVDLLEKEILARRRAERDLRKANRALQTLSDCDQAVARATDEKDMLQRICHSAVTTGGYRAAWVGFAKHDVEKTVQAVAIESSVPIGEFHVHWSEDLLSIGPCGTAIRTGDLCVVRDFDSSPLFKPWRQFAKKVGLLSGISLPLRVGDKVIGAFSIYSDQRDAFDEQETKLLTELAEDMAFGISAIRSREDRKRLEAEVIKVGEVERQRFGHDLHDGLGQTLTGVACLSQALQRRLAKNGMVEAQDAAKIEEFVNGAVSMARAMARGLSPVGLRPDGLAAALKEMGANVAELFRIKCNVECAGITTMPDAVVAMHVYRIAQEAANNAVRHGKAKTIDFLLNNDGREIAMEIHSDGLAFPENAIDKGGMGMRIMQYRADMIGASLDFIPLPGGGVIVSCKLKMPAPQPAQ